MKCYLKLLLLLLVCPLGSATAEDGTKADFDRLGNELTPLGAEMAGNADGTIPAWSGGLTSPPENWSNEQGYIDPFPEDQPLFTINYQNFEQYRDKLSDGVIALMAHNKAFQMPIYPSRRTFALPEHIYQDVRSKAGQAKVVGDGLEGFEQPGLPFPIPTTAKEVMFNHLNGWIGGFEGCNDWMPIFPNGDSYRVGWCSKLVQAPDMDRVKTPNDSLYFTGRYDAPSSLVGTVYLIHEVYNSELSSRRAWIYNAGQRRVRRAPDLAYDNIADGTEGMLTIDDAGGFNGALDRYEWKLLGKREMYIPYNAYKLLDSTLKYSDMIDGTTVKSDLLRFEPHRVWAVEATLKPGKSHIYNRRIFYIDEDSWRVVYSEAYDGRGELWRTAILPLVQLYDVPIMVQKAGMYHDLIKGTLLINSIDNERRQPAMKWHTKGRLVDFQSSSLKKLK